MSSSDSRARGHHFVPQCYLRGFARSDGQLFALDIRKRKGYFTSPVNLCKQRDFNRVDAEGINPDLLEVELGKKFESGLGPALRRVCAARSGNQRDDWVYVLNFIALMAARNPTVRSRLREFKTQLLEMLAEAHLSSKQRWEDSIRAMRRDGSMPSDLNVPRYEQMKSFVEEKRYILKFPHGQDIPAEFVGMNGVLQVLGKRRWNFVAAPKDSPGFITTDHPVCLMHSDGSPATLHRPVGHAVAETTVIFPVCNRLAVLGRFEGEDDLCEVSECYVAQLNTIIALFAYRHVIGPSNRVAFLLDQESVGHGEEIFEYLDVRDN